MFESDKGAAAEEAAKPVKKDNSYKVKKLIPNPMRLSDDNILYTFEEYPLSKEELKNKKFMEHIEKLIELKKIEKV